MFATTRRYLLLFGKDDLPICVFQGLLHTKEKKKKKKKRTHEGMGTRLWQVVRIGSVRVATMTSKKKECYSKDEIKYEFLSHISALCSS